MTDSTKTTIEPILREPDFPKECSATEDIEKQSSSRASDLLADEPLLIIEPSSAWRFVNWRELVRYRDLLRFLTWRGIKGRYAQSALGIGWAVVQPMATALVFTVVFGRLAGVASDGLPYMLFAFCGLVPWTYFSAAMTAAANSLTTNANMLSKVYFPRLIFPLAEIAAKLVDLAVASAVLVLVLVWYQILPGAGLAMLPVLLLIMLATALGMGLWLSALAVQYRDVAYGLNFAVQLMMYLSPVVYPASNVPEAYRWLYGLNPMAGVIEGFRAALLATPDMPWDLLLPGSLVAAALLITGVFFFRRMERLFADVA
jgi:lipopolysaccharide transport system permease protein